jgi:rubredoxin
MSRMRFFACESCDAVHADVTTPPRCSRCGETCLDEVAFETRTAEYFTPPPTGQS